MTDWNGNSNPVEDIKNLTNEIMQEGIIRSHVHFCNPRLYWATIEFKINYKFYYQPRKVTLKDHLKDCFSFVMP